jgi:hypothetical protein
MTTAQWLVGQRVGAVGGGLMTADGGWHAPYVSDHRG